MMMSCEENQELDKEHECRCQQLKQVTAVQEAGAYREEEAKTQ